MMLSQTDNFEGVLFLFLLLFFVFVFSYDTPKAWAQRSALTEEEIDAMRLMIICLTS